MLQSTGGSPIFAFALTKPRIITNKTIKSSPEWGNSSSVMSGKEDYESTRVFMPEERKRLESRFYESMYPEVDDVVMVNVRNVAEMGAYVVLMEYNNIEGMILLSELSRRRIRSINKLIRVNRNEVAMVLRVDKEKGYIDLSKRRVSPEDVSKCEDRYNKAKAVNSVLRHVADLHGLVLEDLYSSVGWPLYKKYGHAYDAFKLLLMGEEDIWEGMDVDEPLKAAITSNVKRRLAPQPVKIRADIEVTCYAYLGVEAVKEALLAGAACSTSETTISVKLIAPPRYVMDTMTLDKDMGKATLEKAIEVVGEKITELGGKINVKMAPKAVSQREESELAAMMERLAMENQETDGDAAEDAYE